MEEKETKEILIRDIRYRNLSWPCRVGIIGGCLFTVIYSVLIITGIVVEFLYFSA